MGDRIVGTAWRIRHTYGRRPLSTFAVTIAAVIALRLSLLAARRGGGTCPSSPGLARVGPVGSAQHSDLDVGRGRRAAAAPQAPDDAGAAVCGSRRRVAAPDSDPRTPRPRRPVAIHPGGTPACPSGNSRVSRGDHRGVILGSAEPGHDRAREPDRWAGDRPGHSDAADSGAERHPWTPKPRPSRRRSRSPRRHRTTPSPPRPPRSRRPIPMLRNPRRSRRPQHSPHRQSPLRTSPLTRHSGPAPTLCRPLAHRPPSPRHPRRLGRRAVRPRIGARAVRRLVAQIRPTW